MELLKEIKSELMWVLSGIGVPLVIGFFSWVRGIRKQKHERVAQVVASYKSIYKNDGCRLGCLIPAGIHTLKNDAEVRDVFSKLMQLEPYHPLRQWNNDVQKIGYIKFFTSVFNTGQSLNKNNISEHIENLSK